MTAVLDPASAVAAGICVSARLRATEGRRAVTARHPIQGCGWCDWPLEALIAAVEEFDPDGPEARTFAGLRRERQEAMVLAAQAIPEPPARPAAPAAEPGWFDLPEGAGA